MTSWSRLDPPPSWKKEWQITILGALLNAHMGMGMSPDPYDLVLIFFCLIMTDVSTYVVGPFYAKKLSRCHDVNVTIR